MASNGKAAKRSVLEPLEQRLLYSADLFGAADADHADDNGIDATLPVLDDWPGGQGDPDTGDAAATREVLFVAAGVEDADTLIDGLVTEGRRIDVVFLDPDEDSLQQISAYLRGTTELDAIHVLAHGQSGVLDFGNDQLDRATLSANRELIAGWSNALSDDADLLIYGCDLAADEAGRLFVDELALLTGADVAASDDLTGAGALGADWQLEYTTGSIQIATAFTADAQEQWTRTLATFTVTNLNDSGTGSLRWAIDQANANGIFDTIEFAVSGTINVTSGFVITERVLIDGLSAPGYAGAPTVTIDGSSTGSGAIGFDFAGSSDGSWLRGLNVHGFDFATIELNTTLNIVSDSYLGTDITGNSLPSTESGQAIRIMDGAHNNTVRDNVIGGYGIGVLIDSSDGAIVQGNLIGIGADGVSVIANGYGVDVRDGSKSALIGTDGDGTNDAAEGNVISGNSSRGINIINSGTDDATIAGNLIGVLADESGTLGNGQYGIYVGDFAGNVQIGGTGANDGSRDTPNLAHIVGAQGLS